MIVKKTLHLFLIFGGLFIFSCESDDNLNPDDDNNAVESFDGTWSMKLRTCECPITQLYMGDNIWTFDSEANTLTIDNNVSLLYPDLDSSGVRAITYTEDSIYFDEAGYLYSLVDASLILEDYPEADGPLYEFIPYQPLPTIDCNDLRDGLLEKNDSLLALEINSLCADLSPYPNWPDQLGHNGSLHSLVNRLNENCSIVNTSLGCYACIETLPALSEITFELDSSGVTITRVADIATPENEILYYTSIH